MIPHTERITFRKFKMSDVPLVHQLNSDPRVMHHIQEVRDLEESTADLERYLNYYDQYPGYGYWPAFFRSSQQFMGWFVVKKLPETEECELGYRLLPEFWGQNLATEGSKACIDYAFEGLAATHMVAVAVPENKASCRVLEKCGFEFQKIDTFYQTQCAYYRLDGPL
ncbi:MAG: GNAT family N-acetyltransferase [Cyclobacteriaceae bacterium]|nr:GNAT family N-acetyltransferase [Cyclobacteriaceae bacterium]